PSDRCRHSGDWQSSGRPSGAGRRRPPSCPRRSRRPRGRARGGRATPAARQRLCDCSHSATDLTAAVCDDLRMAVRRYVWIAAAALATALGILSLVAARHDPAGSFAGRSTLGAIAELTAGWSLVAVGLLFWSRHRRNRFGPLL